ncbi:glycoside hydrolase family 10 protein [Mucisphaera calidilacus]|uniref:Glycosyl hydrolase-like 10 domain-containing protein n=1 Tax=Mucisphaera calidilacus TaxID=2527982 RepID=A0A518C062_9BACT|nr:family 10 glycosylhydrolase [Mucisphaera calidilacus]QDU72605.1 hypothetical protein Pan265_24760 [Mucisphaera calidilacus]
MRIRLMMGLFALLGVLLAWGDAALAQEGVREEVRALWVTRWDYTTEPEVRRIIRNAEMMGFNVVLFQVRGNGTVFYPSAIEAWAWELTSKGPATTGKDPGWDPLAVAIEEAHERGMELHAYVNIFPAWRSQRYAPPMSRQLMSTRPEWLMHDAAGDRMVPRDKAKNPRVNDWYAFLSPGVPEVQQYLAALMGELAANYELDGIHYDYIRYPHEITEVREGFAERAKLMGNWSYDPVSLRRFAEATGLRRPDDNPRAWAAWRTRQVTETTRLMAAAIREHRPDCVLTAAVGADPARARALKYQDYVGWMREGILDAAFTMNYTGKAATFAERVELLAAERMAQGRGVIVTGVGLNHDAKVLSDQVEVVRANGYEGWAGFAYSHLFDRNDGHKAKEQAMRLRRTALFEGEARVPWGRD